MTYRLLFFTLSCFFFISALNGQTNQCLYDSTYTFTYTSNGADSTLVEKALYEYNQAGDFTKILRYRYSNQNAMLYLSDSLVYHYNGNGDETLFLEKYYDQTGMLNSFDERYSYYGIDNQLDSTILWTTDLITLAHLPYRKVIHHFDTNGNNTQQEHFLVGMPNNTFLWDLHFDYDTEGKLHSEIQVNPGNDTVAIEAYTYTSFDSLKTIKIFVIPPGGLEVARIDTFGYDLPNKIREEWSTFPIFGNDKSYRKYQFDDDKGLINFKSNFESAFDNYGRETIYNHDSQNNCRTYHEYFEGTDPNFSDLALSSKTYYFLGSVIASLASIDLEQQVTLYPNPTTGSVFISKGEGDFVYQTALVFNAIGQLKNRHTGLEEISLGEYESGIYFIHFQTEKGLVVKKIVKN